VDGFLLGFAGLESPAHKRKRSASVAAFFSLSLLFSKAWKKRREKFQALENRGDSGTIAGGVKRFA